MAITFVSGAAQAVNSGNNITVTAPASIGAGNLLVAVVYAGSTIATSFTTPSGWTSQGNNGNPGPTNLIQVFTKVATGSEPASYTFTLSSSTGTMRGTVSQYSGPAALDGSPAFNDGQAVSSSTAPSVTPSGTSDTWVVAGGDQVSNVIPSTPTGFTSELIGTGAWVFDKPLSSSSATGTATLSFSSTTYFAVASFLLSPSVASTYLPPLFRGSFVPQVRASSWRKRLSGLLAPESRFPDVRLAGG